MLGAFCLAGCGEQVDEREACYGRRPKENGCRLQNLILEDYQAHLHRSRTSSEFRVRTLNVSEYLYAYLRVRSQRGAVSPLVRRRVAHMANTRCVREGVCSLSAARLAAGLPLA